MNRMADSQSIDQTSDASNHRRFNAWLWTLLLLLAFAGATVAALRWQQPLLALFADESDTEGLPAVEAIAEEKPEAVFVQEEPFDFELVSDVVDRTPIEPIATDSEASIPFADERQPSSNDFPRENGMSIETSTLTQSSSSIEYELTLALIHMQRLDTASFAVDALARAAEIAEQNDEYSNDHPVIKRSLSVMQRVVDANLELAQQRLDRLSSQVLAQRFTALDGPPEEPSTFVVSDEQPEETGFWRGVTESLGQVYRVRQVEQATSTEGNWDRATLAQIRVILLLERARNAITALNFPVYYQALDEAADAIAENLDEQDRQVREVTAAIDQLRNIAVVTPPRADVSSVLRHIENATTPSTDGTDAAQ